MASLIKLQFLLYLALVGLVSLTTSMDSILPGSPDKCGNITIQAPFGIHLRSISVEFPCRPGPAGIDFTFRDSTTRLKAIRGPKIELLHTNIIRREARHCKLICGFDMTCNGLGCYQKATSAELNCYEPQRGFNESKVRLINLCRSAALIEDSYDLPFSFGISSDHHYITDEGKEFSCESHVWSINPYSNATLIEEDSYDFQVGENKPVQRRGRLTEDLNNFHVNETRVESKNSKCFSGNESNYYMPDECKAKAAKDPTKFPYPAGVAISSALGIAILLILCFRVAAHLRHKRHIKEKEEYQRYYQMMHNRLRVFSKKNIEIATNNFDENRILGTGGQGKVYKGCLENNEIVAIKKSKEVKENQRAEFVNEIILLSQINHKNIVRLLGCCLNVKIPMLAYEFIPNGTLGDLLHGKSKRKPIPLGSRLKIAAESAEALDYLHSSISRSIIHGDVKSANILLEENYCAKVSDFGASNLVPIDDTQIVRDFVQGTRGYIDPQYVATRVLTKKSDVYSFGVVLLELITRKKSIYPDEAGENRHLASYFVSKQSQNTLHEMLDKEIVSGNENVIEVLIKMSELATRCLRITGEDRPTMKQVVEALQNLLRSHGNLPGEQIGPEETEGSLSETEFYSIQDASAFPGTEISAMDIETITWG